MPRSSGAALSSLCGLADPSWVGLCPGLPPFSSPVVLLVGALFAAALLVFHRGSTVAAASLCCDGSASRGHRVCDDGFLTIAASVAGVYMYLSTGGKQ